MAIENLDPLLEMNKAIKDFFTHVKKPNILICGYTGRGKTTLIQNIFGKEMVPDEKISHGEPCTQNYESFENQYIVIWDSRGFECGTKEDEFISYTRNFVRERQRDSNIDNHIHLVWYCIDGPGARVTQYDTKLINEIFPNVIVVITKKDITKDRQMEAIQKKLQDSGVNEKNILAVSEEDQDSLITLLRLTMRRLPEAYRDACQSAQIVDMESKRSNAQDIIHSHAMAASAAGGLNPFPMSDSFLLMPIQIKMLVSLAGNYGMASDVVKAALLPVLAKVAGTFFASSLLKLIPILGNIINAVVAFAITEAMGHLSDEYLMSCYIAKRDNKPAPDFSFDPERFDELVKESKKKKR